MSHIGEFELIGRISASVNVPQGVTGIGDDCAIIPQHSGLDTLVTTDLLIEDRHFLLSDVTPEQLGWKSAAVNISDIAAMGGRPVASFLSIALPKGLDAEWVDRFIAGFNKLSGRFGVPLLGGDTSASPDKLFINVTVLGECPHGQAVLRSGARPGDLICVTGFLGDSAAGLKLVLERAGGNQQPVQGYDEATRSRPWLREREGPSRQAGRDERSEGLAHHTPDPASMLISRHYLPVPRVELGQQLAALPGVHAMMDISDGIASDLRHILNASAASTVANRARSNFTPDTLPGNMRLASLNGTLPCKIPTSELDLAQMSMDSGQVSALGAEIDLKALPLSEELRAVCAERGWDAAELAVSGGEDYELLFTAAPGTPLPEGCTVIGRIVDSGSEPGMRCEEPGTTDGGPRTKNGGPAIRWVGSDKDFKGFTHF